MERIRRMCSILSVAVLSLGSLPAYPAGQGTLRQEFQNRTDDRARLAGTWRYQNSDTYTFQKITLVLRADGTYTKTLEARVNGSPYGGTHSGTWTASGTVVNLSGDGNWPAYSHDLSTFRKD